MNEIPKVGPNALAQNDALPRKSRGIRRAHLRKREGDGGVLGMWADSGKKGFPRWALRICRTKSCCKVGNEVLKVKGHGKPIVQLVRHVPAQLSPKDRGDHIAVSVRSSGNSRRRREVGFRD